MSKPILSFCMLTWNRASMLEICLSSFFDKLSNQIPVELIVMDNSSTDGTRNLLEKYRQRENVRIVFNKKNIRLNAYKPLFGMAKGKYIVDLDDDIIEFPQDFDKTIVEYFDAFPDYGFICLNVVQNDKTNGHKPGPECYKEDIRGNKVIEEGPVGGWCAAFRKRHFNIFRVFFNLLNLSMSRVEDGVLSGFLHKLMRKRQGVIRDAVCLHATGPYYAEKFGLLRREVEKYEVVGLIREAQEFRK